MRKSIRILTVGPDQDPLWARLCVQLVEDHWTVMTAGDDAEPPTPGECKRIGFFGDTPGRAKEPVLRYLGGCVGQNRGRTAVAPDELERSDR